MAAGTRDSSRRRSTPDERRGDADAGRDEIGPLRRLVRSLRPVAGLLRPYRALFAGGVATNLMVHVCTFGAAVVGAVLIGKALKGSPTSELWPLVWVIVRLGGPDRAVRLARGGRRPRDVVPVDR